MTLADDDVRIWPFVQAAEAAQALARRAGLPLQSASLPALPAAVGRGELGAVAAWLAAVAPAIGLAVQPLSTPVPELERVLTRAAPALLCLPGRGLVALLGATGNRLRVLTTDLEIAALPLAALRPLLCAALEQPHAEPVAKLLLRAGLRGERAARVRQRLLEKRLGKAELEGLLLLRPRAEGPLAAPLREAGLRRSLLAVGAAYFLEYACTVGAFTLLGQSVLSGRLLPGWMLGVILLMLTAIPLQILGTAHEERLAVHGGVLLKQRLLDGVLASRADALRSAGIGRRLGLVLESETLEWFATSGGLGLALALGEVLLALALLLWIPSGQLVFLTLLPVAGLLAMAASRYHRRRRDWTEQRLELSSLFIESMVGQRTRLAQVPPADWHGLEDQALGRYAAASAAMDRSALWLGGGLGRGGLVVGLCGLLPTLIAGRVTTPELALCLYCLLSLARALERLGGGLLQLSSAVQAARLLRPMLQAESAEPGPAPQVPTTAAPAAGAAQTVLWGRALYYQAPRTVQPVLRGCSLAIRAGERVLLQGPSGGGKSTLAAILAGLRPHTGGLLLAGGLDFPSLGPQGWRRRVSLAPQYHENWVFSATLAFNLLMGRAWPPSPRDLQEAEELCRELGLGPLLARMPAGLYQMLGETGWRLSHGERSRLFLARALLQGADVVLLDESFAALDPETLRLVAPCVIRRARSLVVIAHP